MTAIERIKNHLVHFIRDEVKKAGFHKGVVGLSGGVDSALVMHLTTEALGKENVLAIILPYKTSSPQSIEDALSIINQLNILYESVDISPMVDAYLAKYPKVNNIHRGNILARQRMIVLYDISAREHALVIGTSNKTEILLGYSTLFGDTACAINPIGDLYKTQIWRLAEEVGVPKNIIEKVPTADLWTGQTDEGELGFSYHDVDKLLYDMVDRNYGDEKLISEGFEKEFIEKVRKRIRENEFKRRLPRIAKISE